MAGQKMGKPKIGKLMRQCFNFWKEISWSVSQCQFGGEVVAVFEPFLIFFTESGIKFDNGLAIFEKSLIVFCNIL